MIFLKGIDFFSRTLLRVSSLLIRLSGVIFWIRMHFVAMVNRMCV